MAHTFNRDDVVEYKTGKTYLVGFQRSTESLEVSGWKNGKCYGPSRYLNPEDCKLVGRRVPINDGAAWGFEPLEK